MLALHRSVGKIALLVGALIAGAGVTYLAHSHSPFIPSGLAIITLLPFVMAGMVGVAKTTTV